MPPVLTFLPSSGVTDRPARTDTIGRKLWAKNVTSPGGDDGTKIDATWLNDFAGLIRGVFDGLGFDATPGDDTALARAILQAIQANSSGFTYLGMWNATTNSPTIVSGTGTAADLYIVNVAGTT